MRKNKTGLIKKLLFLLIISITWSCSSNRQATTQPSNYHDLSVSVQSDILTRIFKGEMYELNDTCGYVNQVGDTIIPIDKYTHCVKEIVVNFAIVSDKNKLIAIDQNENRLFDIYLFDNGPDYIQEGLFRVVRDGKIGYADENGQIIIAPQYSCAFPFENGKAKVAYECTQEQDAVSEYKGSKSTKWFYIDKKGEKTTEPSLTD